MPTAESLRPQPNSSFGKRSRTLLRRLIEVLSCALSAFVATGCATFDEDRYIAPLYSEHSIAGGGRQIEALGGMVIQRRDELDGPVRFAGIRPLYIQEKPKGQPRVTEFLTPLGRAYESENEYTWAFAPIARFSRQRDPEGGTRWSFLSLPGLYFSGYPDGRKSRAWFPFAGRIHGFMTWDDMLFVLWPIFIRSTHGSYTNYHVLFPVISWTRGEGASGWRVWPIYGEKHLDQIADRWFFLWPFFQHQDNNLKSSEPNQQKHWMLWPLFGVTRQGTRTSYMFLWPFFGFAHDPRTGFWAYDGPWPIVRIQRTGEDRGIHRTRFWPLYSNYEYDKEGMHSRWFLWPFFNKREETYFGGKKQSKVIIPFYHNYEQDSEYGGRTRYRKVWPFFQSEENATGKAWSTPVLNPLWRFPRIERQWDWIYQLYTKATDGELVRERSWLGLYRREKDLNEERRYLSVLWSNRRYVADGEPVSETSLLFGFLRWRSRPSDSLELLMPAFPGPGWPIERVAEPVIPELLARPEPPIQ